MIAVHENRMGAWRNQFYQPAQYQKCNVRIHVEVAPNYIQMSRGNPPPKHFSFHFVSFLCQQKYEKRPKSTTFACMFERSSAIKNKMNTAGRQREPFLFAVDFELEQGFFISRPLEQNKVLFDFNGIGNCASIEYNIPDYQFDVCPQTSQEYAERFQRVQAGLLRGDSFLTNLTVRTPIETSLSMREIFDYSHALYRLYVPEKFVCFSPEKFVQIKNYSIFSYPMKGTISASVPDCERVILEDYKEKSEHNTIVDLIRNDLNRVATKVKVNRFRYIDVLHTTSGDVLQVSSEIEGRLPENFRDNLGDLMFDLLPAGSVSGAPKGATIQIIREAEKQPRGYYTGVAGYFDGKDMDTCVLIRFIEQGDDEKLYFRSGGGITVNSNCDSEYEEVLQKIYLPF